MECIFSSHDPYFLPVRSASYQGRPGHCAHASEFEKKNSSVQPRWPACGLRNAQMRRRTAEGQGGLKCRPHQNFSSTTSLSSSFYFSIPSQSALLIDTEGGKKEKRRGSCPLLFHVHKVNFFPSCSVSIIPLRRLWFCGLLFLCAGVSSSSRSLPQHQAIPRWLPPPPNSPPLRRTLLDSHFKSFICWFHYEMKSSFFFQMKTVTVNRQLIVPYVCMYVNAKQFKFVS